MYLCYPKHVYTNNYSDFEIFVNKTRPDFEMELDKTAKGKVFF